MPQNLATKVKQRPVLRGELALIAIAIINSFSVYLMLYSLAGNPPISSVPYILSESFPSLTLGAWTLIFQSSLVGLLMLLRLKRGEVKKAVIYLCSFLVGSVFSYLMDIQKMWIDTLPQTLPYCVCYFIISYLVLAFGIAISNYCKMPVIPSDLFPRELALILDKPYKVVKTTFDVICLFVTLACGYFIVGSIIGVGIGTVIVSFTMGKLVHTMGLWINSKVAFVSFLEKE